MEIVNQKQKKRKMNEVEMQKSSTIGQVYKAAASSKHWVKSGLGCGERLVNNESAGGFFWKCRNNGWASTVRVGIIDRETAKLWCELEFE